MMTCQSSRVNGATWMRAVWNCNHLCCRYRTRSRAKRSWRCLGSACRLASAWPASPICRLATAIKTLLWERRLLCLRRAARSCRRFTSGCTTARSWSSNSWPRVLLSTCRTSILTMSPVKAAPSRSLTLMTASMCCLSLTPTSSLLLSALPWRRPSCNWLKAHRRCTICTKPIAACTKRLVYGILIRF